MVERILRSTLFVPRLEKELEVERTRCTMALNVSTNQQRIIDILTDHRDVLLANIRDLRIEASCLRRDKDRLAIEISKLLDANRRRVEGGGN